MRNSFMKVGLLWLCLFLSFVVIKSVNAEPAEPMYIDLSNTVLHNSRLHTLRLWSGVVGTLQVRDSKVRFSNGLVVWDSENSHNIWANTHVVIGWWKNNTVTVEYAGVWWWQSNAAKGSYAVVWWWSWNEAQWQHSAVVGWQANVAEEVNSVVVGWQWNRADGLNSVVVGWSNNVAKQNSLVLGKNWVGNAGSFAWNGSSEENHGYIDARKWILVGTTTPLNWVNLVVGGAVQIAWNNNNDKKATWEIRYIKWSHGWCFYAYDGDKWHVLNRWLEKERNTQCADIFASDAVADYCEFGNTVVWNNDVVTGYVLSYSTGSCTEYGLVCQGGHLWTSAGALADKYYPYCYHISM